MYFVFCERQLEIQFWINDSESKVIFVDANFSGIIENLIKENKSLKSSKKSEKSLNATTIETESFKLEGHNGELIVQENASMEMLRRAADKSHNNKENIFSIASTTKTN